MIQKNSEVKILNHPFWKGKIAKVINVDEENDEVTVRITYINSNQEEKNIIETFSFDDLKEVEKESYSELEINNLNNLNEDFTVSFDNLPGRDYFDKIKQFARRIAQEVENKDIFKFTLDKDNFINIGLDPREFYNDLIDFLAEEGNYGISSIQTNHSNPSLFDYEYTVTLNESKKVNRKMRLTENDKNIYRLSDDEIKSFDGIEIPGYYDTWYAIDAIVVNGKTYYLMENEGWGDETGLVVTTEDFSEIYDTYDDIETCLIDEGILDDYLEEELNKTNIKEAINKINRRSKDIFKEDFVTVENENKAEDILTKYIYVEDIDGKKIPTYIILDRIASAENLTKEDILDLVYKLNKKYKVFRVDAPNYERLILAAPEIKIDEIQEDFADYLLGKSIVTEITK